MTATRTADPATETMTRAVITGPRQLLMEKIPVPTPGPGQILVRMTAAALCTWEQRTFSGVDTSSYPLVGGHENAGEVAATGEKVEGGISVGDQVAVSGLKRCGQCYSCRTGVTNLCDNSRSQRIPDKPWGPGGFGDFVLAEAYQIYKVGPVASSLEAALTEPLACVLHDMKRHPIRNGDIAVIVGAGIMGLLHLVIAKRTPSFVIVSEPELTRRQKALELGADAVIDPSSEDFVARVKELSGGRGSNVTYLAIGSTAATEAAVLAAAKRGVVSVYASVHPKTSTITVNPNVFHDREVRLSGSIAQDPDDFLAAAELIGKRTVDLRPLISAVYPLSRLEDAFAAALRKDTYRVLVQPDAQYRAAQARGDLPAARP